MSIDDPFLYMFTFNISTRSQYQRDSRNNLFCNLFFLHLACDDSGHLSTKIYDKRDDFSFNFKNFPYLCGNINSLS